MPPEDFVKSIEFEKNQLITTSGRHFSYERLCLCHGARPKVIAPVMRKELSQFILGIRDTESVEKFQTRLSDAKRICILGNGGIATELVYELQAIDIVWAIKDDSIAATFVDPGAGEFFISDFYEKGGEKDTNEAPIKRMKYTVSKDRHKKDGSGVGSALGPDWHGKILTQGSTEDGLKRVHVEYNCNISRILSQDDLDNEKVSCDVSTFQRIIKHDKNTERTKWNIYVKLDNGKIFGCDFIVSATGVIPNGDAITLLQNKKESFFELSPDKAIYVNDQMETNIKNIYAAGDVSHVNWDRAQHWFQMRLWTQARQMGMYAAQSMVSSIKSDGHEKQQLDFCFEMFTHATKFFGYKVVLLGLFNGQKDIEYEVLLRVTKGKEYVKCVMNKQGRMQGAILIGETDLEETFENLILNQIDLSVYGVDLLDPNVDIEDYFD